MPPQYSKAALDKFEDNKAFFKQFGARLAKLRKERRVTQAAMADALGYSQQQIQSFEKGRRRIPLSVIPHVLELLEITFEELMGMSSKGTKPRKRGPSSKAELLLSKLSELPRSQQKFVTKMIETAILQAED